MNSLVNMQRVNKSYTMGDTRLHVLKDVDMQVERGEFVAVLGASGSGKTTLMNIIGCMDMPDEGTYMLDGAEVSDCNDSDMSCLRNSKIGFVFQKYHLIPQYTVMQNVIIPLLARGMPRRKAQERARQYIDMVGLKDRVTHKPNELSGGQQQRVAIARALVGEPSLLLADEPTGSLDANTSEEILSLFLGLHQQGNTIIMITHDKDVAAYSQRVLHIDDGLIS